MGNCSASSASSDKKSSIKNPRNYSFEHKFRVWRRKLQPKKDVEFSSGSVNKMHFVVATSPGYRSYQEDRFIAEQLTANVNKKSMYRKRVRSLTKSIENQSKKESESPDSMLVVPISIEEGDSDCSVFGIFDGHGFPAEGHRVSEFCQREFSNILYSKIKSSDHLNVTNNLNQSILYTSCFRETCLEVDTKLRSCMPKIAADNGCTATVMLVTRHCFVFSNVGDSRSFLMNSRTGKVIFSTLDHKPNLRSEHARVVAAGGFVHENRVNGDLAVSRTLGDLSFKPRKAPLRLCTVSPEPDVKVLPKELAVADLLVQASDGLFDVMRNEELASIISLELLKAREAGIPPATSPAAHFVATIQSLLELVVQDCIVERLSDDNITVSLVVLGGAAMEDFGLQTEAEGEPALVLAEDVTLQ